MPTISVMDRAAQRWLALAVYAALVAYVVLRDLGAPAFDDSYFFKRFALHVVEHGVYAWNVDDGPVHGATSQLFGWLVVGVVVLTKTHFIALVRAINAAALIACCGLMLRDREHPVHPGVVLMTLGNALVLVTLRTGMETAVTLMVLAAALRWMRGEVSGALWTALVYLVRPDVAVIPAVVVLVRSVAARRWPLRFALTLSIAMGALWLTLWAYYGTALPLSFHMKTMALHSYGPHFSAGRWSEKVPYVGALAAVIAGLVWGVLRARVWRANAQALGWVVATLVFWTYHLVSTHEIMGYGARFYVPGLVPLGLAAARLWPTVTKKGRALVFAAVWGGCVALAYGRGWIPNAQGFSWGQLPWSTYAAVLGAFVAVTVLPSRAQLWGVIAALCVGVGGWLPWQGLHLRSDREILVRHDREVTTTRGVFDVARCLPAGSTVYHSEMGVTGLALYRMRTVDLAGIVSADIGLNGMHFEARCVREQPEAIFLPHRNYRALNEEIRKSTCFEQYTRVVDRSSSALHVRSDLAEDFMGCATDVHAWRDAHEGAGSSASGIGR